MSSVFVFVARAAAVSSPVVDLISYGGHLVWRSSRMAVILYGGLSSTSGSAASPCATPRGHWSRIPRLISEVVKDVGWRSLPTSRRCKDRGEPARHRQDASQILETLYSYPNSEANKRRLSNGEVSLMMWRFFNDVALLYRCGISLTLRFSLKMRCSSYAELQWSCEIPMNLCDRDGIAKLR